MADRPLKEFDGRTPLEASHTPNLDAVAKDGFCGIMDIISPGRPPGSDIATLALLGYDPLESYRGRGALEAVGAGEEVSPGDVAFRGNFAYVDDNETVLDRRAGRVEGSVFRGYLSNIHLKENSDVEIIVRPTLGHRLAIILKGEGLSWKVSDIDPHKNGVSVMRSHPLDGSAEARKTADVVNELYRLLRNKMGSHPWNKKRIESERPPANSILLRGAGEPLNIKPLNELYGIRCACIAVTPTVRGACLSAGFDLYDAPGGTGGMDTDTISKAETAEEVLSSYDIVFVHVKGTDVASHDGDSNLKIAVIEKIDALVGHLLKNVDLSETYIAVTADHTTSIKNRRHVGDPVPVAILGPEVRTDNVAYYSERACSVGGMGRFKAMDLMPIILNLNGNMRIYGS